jgi:hypothetical protein
VELFTFELGVVTFGVALGVVWCGLVSLKKGRCGVVWFGSFGLALGVVWCGLVSLEKRQVWCGVDWQNISKKAWCGVVWHLKRPTMPIMIFKLSLKLLPW